MGFGSGLSARGYVRFPPIADIGLVSAFDPLRTSSVRQLTRLTFFPLLKSGITRSRVNGARELVVSTCQFQMGLSRDRMSGLHGSDALLRCSPGEINTVTVHTPPPWPQLATRPSFESRNQIIHKFHQDASPARLAVLASIMPSLARPAQPCPGTACSNGPRAEHQSHPHRPPPRCSGLEPVRRDFSISRFTKSLTG